MAITIEIPTAFRRFTEGAPRVDSGATTVGEALHELTTRFPALSRHVRDEQGQIRQFLNVYLNEEDIRFLGGEASALKDGDRVLLVPSIAGGGFSVRQAPSKRLVGRVADKLGVVLNSLREIVHAYPLVGSVNAFEVCRVCQDGQEAVNIPCDRRIVLGV